MDIVIDIINLDFTGQDLLPRGKGHNRLQGAPPHPPPIHIRKTPGSPYSYTNSAWVPQNYQHSRTCETGPPV